MTTTQQSIDSRASIGAGLLFGTGAAVLGALSRSRPLTGVAVYTVAAILAFAVWAITDDSIETETQSQSPAESTLTAIGVAAAVVFPGLVAADGLGYTVWTPTTVGIALTIAGVFVVYGGVSLKPFLLEVDQ